MKFTIITHAIHKHKGNKLYAYEPYVREMNLWLNYVNEVKIVAPKSNLPITSIDSSYLHRTISHLVIPSFNVLTFFSLIKTLFLIPIISIRIFKAMLWADHIHLRCPGNVGLLGCFIQMLFPRKNKTVKYAGNWDPKSKQPLSYRIQKWVLSNTFFTKNCKVLVYGEWKNQSRNIVPFFTASYHKNEIEIIKEKDLSRKIKFLYVGAFSIGKQPMLSVKTIEQLVLKNLNVQLDMYGNGEEFELVGNYIREKSLQNNIFLHGNKSKKEVKTAYQNAHFLIFVSKSEGWPKVVAEAMFWNCLPISSEVSCIKYMLDNGNRGTLVNYNTTEYELSDIIIDYLNNENLYKTKVIEAQKWSQTYTLEKFETEIQKLLV